MAKKSNRRPKIAKQKRRNNPKLTSKSYRNNPQVTSKSYRKVTKASNKKHWKKYKKVYFANILVFLFVIIIFNLFFWPPKKHIIEHKTYSSNTNGSAQVYIKYIDYKKPSITFIGNSMVKNGVIPDLFSEQSFVPAITTHRSGASSAWWYLCVKNVILKAKHKIPVVVIVFRDYFLTMPNYRVKGKGYEMTIDMLCSKQEPILDRLAYLNGISSVEYFLMKNWPLYQKRSEYLDGFNTTIKTKIGNWFDYSLEEVNSSIDSTFQQDNMVARYVTSRQLDVESVKGIHDFNENINKSFLPEIIKLCKESKIQVIFVRLKRRRDLSDKELPEELIDYNKMLADYLNEQDIPLIDFTNEPKIEEKHFGHGDHYNGKGAKIFTGLLASKLESYIIEYKRDSAFIDQYKKLKTIRWP